MNLRNPLPAYPAHLPTCLTVISPHGSTTDTDGFSAPGAQAVRGPRSGRGRADTTHLRTIWRSNRPMVDGTADPGDFAGRSRRVHLAKHRSQSRRLLRNSADWRGHRPCELPADAC